MAKAPNNPRARFDPPPEGGWTKDPSYQVSLRNSTSRAPYIPTELQYRGCPPLKKVVDDLPGTRMFSVAGQAAIAAQGEME